MNSEKHKHWSMGITLRTALLSWLVTLATLLIFVTMIIPQQKRMFLENLDSKAHGVAISLRDVAAGSAVNEDFSSVVDHCTAMLKDDRALDYLVITKNDGFSLISDRAGWRSETNATKEWRPDQRESTGGIAVVPLFNRRVFRYSQPFDYSGIQWGWIHVGLSLESYDRSVAMVYQRTGMLAVFCILLSLLASVLYAKRLVHPILKLRQVVQKVADGDLSARALIDRGDELGSLGNSVNGMTESLLRRDQILQSVRFAAQEFLCTTDWKEVIGGVLAKMGEATGVSRIRVFANQADELGNLTSQPRYEWTAVGIGKIFNDPNGRNLVLRASDFPAWVDLLTRGEMIAADIDQVDDRLRQILIAHGFKSILLLPIVVEKVWWGVLTLAECQRPRQWTDAERDSIRAAADMLGAAIARQRAQEALEEAKATLERRVAERTKELQEQVAAKETARAALAESQQRLVETSRRAGMAEVATGVLHNVGNVLNSVNVSSTLVYDRLRQSKMASLLKVGQILREHHADMAAFLATDPRGQRLPSLLANLADHLGDEQKTLIGEMELLTKNLQHIKEIVAMQQSYAKVSGVLESLRVTDIVEDALQMNAAALGRHKIEVAREFQEVPLITIDKHKVLQILVNLIRNAKYAMTEKRGSEAKCLRVSVGLNGQQAIQIAVKDNGIGIDPENLTRIFAHGFTTKKDGHGFGLHMGALAAKEMGGALIAYSDGPGQGAMFVLELPIARAKI